MSQELGALSAVYEQALSEAQKLLQHAKEHYNEAACDDPARLQQILDDRDNIINTLAALDEQAELLLQGLTGDGQSLPESLRALQDDISSTLRDVAERDRAFADVISKNLEALKSLTLKARDATQLARSIGTIPEPGGTIDFTR